MDKKYYIKLRNSFLPDKLRLIFILESPPASGKYFYDTTGKSTEPLFKEMMTLIGCEAMSKKEGLEEFKSRGLLLIDATYYPVNELKGKKRDEAILNDFSALLEDLRHLNSEKSVPIVLVKVNVCELLEEKLLSKGYKILNNGIRIPFPSTGQQKRFREKVRELRLDFKNSRYINQAILGAILREFVRINGDWKIMCQLFDSGQGNVELLNKSGSYVFYLLQILIIDSVMLSLCRITDPAKSSRKLNASILGLLESSSIPKSERESIDELLEKLSISMEKIRFIRHKRMAHSSADVKTKVVPVPKIKYDNIESSIEAIKSILNILENSSGDYVPAFIGGQDGTKLLRVLSQVKN